MRLEECCPSKINGGICVIISEILSGVTHIPLEPLLLNDIWLTAMDNPHGTNYLKYAQENLLHLARYSKWQSLLGVSTLSPFPGWLHQYTPHLLVTQIFTHYLAGRCQIKKWPLWSSSVIMQYTYLSGHCRNAERCMPVVVMPEQWSYLGPGDSGNSCWNCFCCRNQ